MVRGLLYGLLGILLVAIILILVAPSFIDWNSYRDDIVRELREASGQDIAIDGDISFAVLPKPHLSVGQVRLPGSIGAGRDPLLALEAMQVRVELLPLLSGEVRIERVELLRPVVTLEVLSDGRVNWALDELESESGGAPAAQPSAEREEGSFSRFLDRLAVRLDNFVIREGEVVYRDLSKDSQTHLSAINAVLSARSLSGPFLANGMASFEGQPYSFDLDVGLLSNLQRIPLTLILASDQHSLRARLSGVLLDVESEPRLEGRVEAKSDNVAAALNALAEMASSPRLLQQDAALSASLAADRSALALEDIELRLGRISANGVVRASLGAAPNLELQLVMPRVNLDDALAASAAPAGQAQMADAGQESSAAKGSESGNQAERAGGGFELPADWTASLDLRLDAVIYAGQVAREGRLRARLAEQVIEVEEVAARLPGGSNIGLSGEIREAEGQPRFDGGLQASSDNLRAALAWLGLSLKEVPSGRLRRAGLSARLAGTPELVQVSDLDLRVDTTHVAGGVVLALRRRLGLGVGLRIDKIDLDAYLPSAKRPAGERAAHAGGQQQSQGPVPDVPQAATPLESFDANLNIAVASLRYQGRRYTDVNLQGTFEQGNLRLDNLSIEDVTGVSASLGGRVADLGRDPSLDLAIELALNDAARLAQATRMHGRLPAQLTGSTLSGALRGKPEALDLDLTLEALDGRLALAGSLQAFSDPLAFDLRAEVSHPDLAALARVLEEPGLASRDLGELELKTKLSGNAEQFSLDAIEGRIGSLPLAGSLSVDRASERPAVTGQLATGRLPLALLLGTAAAEEGTAKSAEKGGRGRKGAGVAGRPDDSLDLTALRDFDARLALAAEALLIEDLTVEEPRLEARLTEGLLDLDRFAGTLAGGTVQMSGQLDARGETPSLALSTTGRGIQSGPVLRALFDFDRVSGPVNLEAQFSSAGASEPALLKNLSGEGRYDGSLDVEAKAEEQLGAMLLGVLGDKVKEVRGITDATTTLFQAFSGAPAKLTGSFTAETGNIRSQDTRLVGQGAEARVVYRVNLPDEQLDLTGKVYRGAVEGEPYLTLDAKGPLDSPNLRISGQPFRREAAPAPSPTPEQPKPEQEAPSPIDQLPDDTKELLRGILEGLKSN